MKTRADWIWLFVVALGSFAVSLACRLLFPDPVTLEFLKNVELAGVVTSAVAVFLVLKQEIWAFPIGIVSLIIYAYFFFQGKLYGDASLQVAFLIAQFHGWYSWAWGGKSGGQLEVRRTSPKQLAWLIVAFAGLYAVLFAVLSRVAGKQPGVDGLTTAMSLVAQYMVNRKLLENWLVWIAVDAIYVPWYWKLGYKPTAILYGVFLILAVAGYLEWRKRLPSQGSGQPN